MRLPWRRAPDQLSEEWLKEAERLEQRVEFHGVSIRFPIKKLLNESPLWNRAQQERKRA